MNPPEPAVFGPVRALWLLPSRAISSRPAVQMVSFVQREVKSFLAPELRFVNSERMNEKQIFGMALGLEQTPWEVVEITLDVPAGRMDIRLDFPPGSQFPRPSDGKLCPVYDTEEKTWRHLNFFQYECHVHAWVPRVNGGDPDGIKTVQVPWARRPGFTLMMEAMMMVLCQTGMTVAEASRVMGETAHRVWRVLFHHVKKAHEAMDVSSVQELTVDETSVRRGHDYVTIFCEPGRRATKKPTRVLFVTEGKDAPTVARAKDFLAERGVAPNQIKHICADMSPAYKKGVEENFPDALLVFDFFHVVGLLTTGVDAVRRRESAEFPDLLKGTRYLWLKNEENLSEDQRQKRSELCKSKLQTAKAHCHLAAFQDLLKAENFEEAVGGLKWWYNWVCHSRIKEMIKVAKSIKEHWDGIVAYLKTRLTNGAAEALNGIIQTAKRKSRGFRNFVYFRAVIYLVGSKLKFDLPCPIPGHPQQTS
ncbi:MAG: ISL3 family transposase [Actinobacteria bacterium]|nr:ISL3 family transposase [Actinomycetota bacterium]